MLWSPAEAVPSSVPPAQSTAPGSIRVSTQVPISVRTWFISHLLRPSWYGAEELSNSRRGRHGVLRRPPSPLLAEPRQMRLVLSLQQVGYEQRDDIETPRGRQRRQQAGGGLTGIVELSHNAFPCGYMAHLPVAAGA